MKGINKKKIFIILVIYGVVLSIFASGTFAYLRWVTGNKNKTVVEFTLNRDFSCSADTEGDVSPSNVPLAPATCTDPVHAIKRELIVQTEVFGELPVYMDLWMDVKSISPELSATPNLKYAITTDPNSCTNGVLISGNLQNKQQNDVIEIFNKRIYPTSRTDTYYLYVWLDAAETNPNTMNKSFNLSINGNCENTEHNFANAPTLDNGMIPVKISNDGVATTVSSTDSTWYNYDNKEWANVVLVKSNGTKTRDYYKSNTGVTVAEDDILAYYVWIPRYKYKIWTLNESSTGQEQTIDIVFESADASVTQGSKVGDYITHPAFVWDGNTIAGIWVGKFESSANTDSTCYTSDSAANCVASNVSPRIVPNVQSLRYQNVSTKFTTSQKFSASGNIYGLSNTNSHMMKNSEWGAVAYLSHSKYGINSEIRINNNSNYITGCGASVENGEGSTECQISYNASSTPQSTTGNITGIYDMSGGVPEYVMGVLADSGGNPRSGYDAEWNSGFNGLLGNDTSYTSGLTFPASKYYDLYTSEDSTTACNGGPCYGHALSETAEWYDDDGYFVKPNFPWVIRGGNYINSANAGAFYSNYNFGSAIGNYSWRSVLVVGYGA